MAKVKQFPLAHSKDDVFFLFDTFIYLYGVKLYIIFNEDGDIKKDCFDDDIDSLSIVCYFWSTEFQ